MLNAAESLYAMTSDLHVLKPLLHLNVCVMSYLSAILLTALYSFKYILKNNIVEYNQMFIILQLVSVGSSVPCIPSLNLLNA